MADGHATRNGRRLALAVAVASAWLLATPMREAVPAATAAREVELGDFDQLVLRVPADVEIVIGDRNHARLEAEARILDSIDFRASSGRLQVAAGRSFQTRERIRITITCRRLVGLDAQASVEAIVNGLEGERFSLAAADSASVSLQRLNLSALEVDIAGSATVTAAGKVRAQRVRIAGAGGYDARELASQVGVVDASGSSDVVIDSRDWLEATVSGAATVQYGGSPAIRQSVSGAGTLERR